MRHKKLNKKEFELLDEATGLIMEIILESEASDLEKFEKLKEMINVYKFEPTVIGNILGSHLVYCEEIFTIPICDYKEEKANYFDIAEKIIGHDYYMVKQKDLYHIHITLNIEEYENKKYERIKEAIEITKNKKLIKK